MHVPFCVSRCDYCAFATWSDRFEFLDTYLEMLHREINIRSEGMRFSSVFFGGGTPSILSIEQLASILSLVEIEAGAEVTLEANPESLHDDLGSYIEIGINRVSLGVQSLRDNDLKLLGRDHKADQAKNAISRLSGSKLDYSCDFIFGVNGGNPNFMVSDIAELIASVGGPSHLSVYGLTVEPGTPLALNKHLHPNDDQDAQTYLDLDRQLCESGFQTYEISNACRNGQLSKHNWNYWMQGEYLGVGPGAHSHLDGVRSWNIRDSYRWGHAVDSGLGVIAGQEQLSEYDRIFEGLSLALRTVLGVPYGTLPLLELPDDLYTLTQDKRIVLSAKGRLLENQIAKRLLNENVTLDQLLAHQAIEPSLLLD